MPTILIAPLALVWLVNHPDYQLPKQGHVVLYGTLDRASTEASKENGNDRSDIEPIKDPDDPIGSLFKSSSSDWSNKSFSDNSIDDWSRAVVDSIDCLCHDGGVRDSEGSRNLVAATRSRVRAFLEAQQQAVALPETESQDVPVPQEALRRAFKARTKVCVRGKEASEVVTFRGSPPPDPYSKWIGQQDETEISKWGRLLI
jgi:hypothetical protein